MPVVANLPMLWLVGRPALDPEISMADCGWLSGPEIDFNRRPVHGKNHVAADCKQRLGFGFLSQDEYSRRISVRGRFATRVRRHSVPKGLVRKPFNGPIPGLADANR